MRFQAGFPTVSGPPVRLILRAYFERCIRIVSLARAFLRREKHPSLSEHLSEFSTGIFARAAFHT
jgi:hypothetical protein